MTDSQWTDDAPPKKKAIPTWLWACGAGCFVLLVFGILGSIFFFREVKKAMDPELQWPKVREILYFDERPADVTMRVGFGLMGVETYFLTNGELILSVMRFSAAQRAEAEKLLDPSYSAGLGTIGKRKNVEAATMEVLGAERKVLHYIQSTPGQSKEEGQSLLVDLSDEFPGSSVFLQFTRPPVPSGPEEADASVEGGTKITQEEVGRFLRGFSVR